MTLKTGLATALVAAVVAALVTAATLGVVWRAAPGVVDAPGSALEEKRVIKIVRNYLTDNPEILVEMTTELDKRQAEEQAAQQSKTISENKDALFRSKLSFTGNPDGDVTLVEFFDYNCGYCKRALPDIVKLVDEDSKVRLVLKELPIFGEDSEAAAKGALAAMKQNKYFEMHQKLYSESGKADKEKVLKVAGELGLDVDQLQKDMESDDVKKGIEEARDLAQKLGLQGTPLFLIGDKVIPGAPDDLHDQLKEKVAEVREKGCAVC
ncbi:MAG: DsbA family protein [Methylibium sp.]|jgi:protein-disulfide isomerase|nr:DsbA family protein [Methyloceanibacter sp.]